MLIPSIDLQGGQVVQLVRGEEGALSYKDPAPWIAKFRNSPRVQLIDLDAAKGMGSNHALVKSVARELPVQIGGGIRTPKSAQAALELGARAVIIGSALFDGGRIRSDIAAQFADAVGAENLIFAVDTKRGNIAVRGWRQTVSITPENAIAELQQYCDAFLYTHIDREGTLSGFSFDRARELRAVTQRRLIVAGGIRSAQEVEALHEIGVDAVVGMALYMGLLQPEDISA